MNNTHEEKHYYYTILWIVTILFGVIGLFFAVKYIDNVTSNPENGSIYLEYFKDWVSHGSLLCFVLFYFYIKTLYDGIHMHRYISTLIKLTIWSVVITLTKMMSVYFLSTNAGTTGSAYVTAAVTHLDFTVTFGMLVFPIVTICLIILSIRFKLKNRS